MNKKIEYILKLLLFFAIIMVFGYLEIITTDIIFRNSSDY